MMSSGARILDWVTAVSVALGIVASIPMLPVLIIGWAVLWVRSPAAGLGLFRATPTVVGRATRGRLEGFNSTLLFPMVVAGWFLIAMLAFGVVIGEPAQREVGRTNIGFLLFLVMFIGPPFLAYRSMYPEISGVPFDEWLGSRNVGWIGVLIIAWIAGVWLVWSITTWTTFLGTTWTTICTFVLVCAIIVLPGVFALIKPRGSRRLYRFVGVAIILGLVSVGAYLAGVTPNPRWP